MVLKIFLLSLISCSILAQDWIKTYGIKGWGYEEGRDIYLTSDGGYIIVGSTSSYRSAGESDVYLIKTDAYGDTIWTKTYGGSNEERGFCVQQTFDGGYIIAGSTNGGDDIYLIKTDAYGNIIWTKTFDSYLGGHLDEEKYYVKQTFDSGYIVLGDIYRNESDIYLIKLNTNGDTVWTKIYGDTLNEYGYSVQQTSDSGYIILGGKEFVIGCIIKHAIYLIKTNSNGDTIWTKILEDNEDAPIFGKFGYSICQTYDDGYIIVGYIPHGLIWEDSVYLIKTNANGDVLWTKTYGYTGRDLIGYSVQQTSDSGYIIVGYSRSSGPTYDIFLIKTDIHGNLIWIKFYDGPGFDFGYSVKQTSDTGYVIVGKTDSLRGGKYDVYVIKTDANGDIIWARTYGYRGGHDLGYSVLQINNKYIVAGTTSSLGLGPSDVYLIKTNSQGDTLWTKTIGGFEREFSYCIQQTTDSGYIISGEIFYYHGIRTSDVYLIKTDANGDTLWTKTFGGRLWDYGYWVQQTFDSGYIIVGATNSYSTGRKYDVYLIKTNANGDTLWTKTFGGSEDDFGYCVQQTTDGGYVIVGTTYSYGAGSYDVYLIKTDANGDTLWTRTFGGNRSDRGSCIQQTTDGGYIIVGTTNSYGAGSSDVYLIKTDANGDTLWTKTFGGNRSDGGKCIHQTIDSGYIIVGTTESYGAGECDVYLIKTDANGNVIWSKTYGGAQRDYGVSVRQTLDGGYIVTGYSNSYGPGGHDVLLLYVSSIGVIEQIFPKNNYFIELNPNPVGSDLQISYSIPIKSKINISIYNLSGQFINSIIDDYHDKGNYTIKYPIDKLYSGVYFIKFIADNYSTTQKIIILR